MQKIRIAGKSYLVPTHWDDITLSQCAWLYQKVNEQSPEILNYYRAFTTTAVPDLPEDIEALSQFTSEVLGYLAGIPGEVIKDTRSSDIVALSIAVFPRFVLGVLGNVDYQVRNIASFRHGGRRYIMPRTGIDIGGMPTPLSGISAIELCHVSDIICTGNISLAPLAIAIVCRKKREKYDEQKVQARAGEFKELPASVYWELWALVSGAHEYLQREYPECYPKVGGEAKGKAAPAAWSDTLVAMADNKPSELEYLQRMNGYDFVHLMSENIKREKGKWKMQAALTSCGVR